MPANSQGSAEALAGRISPQAWFAFAVIFLLGFMDFFVRQLIVGLFPLLKTLWGLSDRSLSLLASIVPAVCGIAVLPAAFIIDRWSRVKAVTLMALIWSLATLAGGIAGSYGHLLAARGFVGLGEAGYGPAGVALLAWHFPSRLRATVISAALAAAALGSTLGVAAGGILGEVFNWRAAFLLAGGASLAVAALAPFIRDYPTAPLARRAPGEPAGQTGGAFLRSPTALLVCCGGAAQLFVISTLTVWLPSFFGRSFGLQPAKAGFAAAGAILLGSVGAVIWSRLADQWSQVNLGGRLFTPAIGAAATAVAIASAFQLAAPGAGQAILILLGAFVMTSCYGPVNAVVMDVTQPGLRATAAAMVSVFQNLFGLAAGPVVIGMISDRYGLERALSVLPVFSLVSAACFLGAARFYAREHKAMARWDLPANLIEDAARA